MKAGVRSAVLPLVLIWLALHAALLGLFLAFKLLGAKAVIARSPLVFERVAEPERGNIVWRERRDQIAEGDSLLCRQLSSARHQADAGSSATAPCSDSSFRN